MGKRGNGEGSIFQRKDGRWAAALTLSNGRRKALYGKTRREVGRLLTAALRSQAEGLPVSGDRQTVGQFLETWLKDRAALRVRPLTLKSYQAKVRKHIAPTIGNVRLSKLTPQHVERMLNEQLASGVPARSVAHHRAVLRNALNAAMRWGLVGRNAAALVDSPPVPQREIRALTPRDARALLEAVNGDRLEGLFTVALALGLRQSEALGLRWSDVPLEAATLRVERTMQRVKGEYTVMQPKTARSRRTVPLPRPVVQALRKHRVRQLEERLKAGAVWSGEEWGDLVFADEIGGPLSGFHVSRRLKKLLAAAGLPSMRYHDLRHGAASLMAAQGVPARVAMEILGHAQISTTMDIYAHVAPELEREAMERVAASIWASS